MRALALLVAVLLGTLVTCGGPRASSAADGALSWQEAQRVICFDGASWDCATAMAVAARESGYTMPTGERVFNPNAYNPSCRCVGLFQIAGVHGHPADLLSIPEYNVAVAHGLYVSYDWRPWRY